MPSELVLYLFLLDICKERCISAMLIKRAAKRLYSYIQRYGAMTVAIGQYTLSLHVRYPRVKRQGYLYVPVYLAY